MEQVPELKSNPLDCSVLSERMILAKLILSLCLNNSKQLASRSTLTSKIRELRSASISSTSSQTHTMNKMRMF